MIPCLDHWRKCAEEADRDFDLAAKDRFEGNALVGIELHEAVNRSIDAHPNEVDLIVVESRRQGPPGGRGDHHGGNDQRAL
jgi:hypothetical protein